MKNCSKEFIIALNGMLNGEKWARINAPQFYHTMIRERLRCCGCMSACFGEKDFMATDWMKVD